MPLYDLTYQFESSGGNIEYQTRQTVEKEASIKDVAVTMVTTGIALSDDRMQGTAIVETASDISPTDVFDAAVRVEQLSPDWQTVEDQAVQTAPEPANEPQAETAIQRLENSDDLRRELAEVSATPGRGCLLNSDLTRCRPHDRDRWFVWLKTVETDATTGHPLTDLVEFFRSHLDQLQTEPALKIGCFHSVTAQKIRIGLVASRTSKQEAEQLARQTNGIGSMNFYRFALSKGSLVVGSSTHGPGHTDVTFASPSGDQVSSETLAYRRWHEGLAVHYHPLGVIVDGDLYRPVIPDSKSGEPTVVGDPIFVDTYRGSEAKPWQFGVTRYENQILITQARAGPDKFDPVLKRLPIQTQVLEDDPLVFSHLASRRVWNADPVNLQVQSQRSEGLRTQFLYADCDGWHLIQPKDLGDSSGPTDSTFQPTQLSGVSVRSSLLRSETADDTKATVEHEYRITEDVFDSCSCLYALSYHEANEESFERLQWDVADARAYEIVREDRGE